MLRIRSASLLLSLVSAGIAGSASELLAASDLVAGPDSTTPASEAWIPEYARGLAEAKKTGKDLMVEFTGSDWCTWCIKLEKEILDRPEFIAVASQDFVLVQLDFPRAEANQSHIPDRAGNEVQSQRFRITGFPTVVLMTSEGRPYASTGYQRDRQGVAAYLEHFDELRAIGHGILDSVDQLTTAIEASEGEDKVAAWRALHELAESVGESAPLFENLIPGLQQAFSIDPDGSRGLYGAAVAILLREAAIDEVLVAAVDQLDPRNEYGIQLMLATTQSDHVWNAATTRRMLAMIEKLEGLDALDAEHARFFFANAAFWSDAYLEGDEIPKKWAAKARPLATEAQVIAVMDEILGR